jgi:uncharacterized membrane protein
LSTPADLLAEVPLFALLDDAERAALAERLERRALPAGTIIFRYGDPGDALYAVRSGRVEVFTKNDTGEEIILERPGPGDFFGEISLLDGGPRTASARVVEDLDALVIERADLDDFLRATPAAAMHLLEATGKRLRETTNLLRHSASRNVNDATEDTRTLVMKSADAIAAWSGSIPFLVIHCVLFAGWILLNVGPVAKTEIGGFDPFPFGLLTMVVSLEAIILSVFVLLSQNRQVERDRVRNDIEYDVNLKAELEVAHLHEKVDEMNGDVLARLEALEKAVRGGRPSGGHPHDSS